MNKWFVTKLVFRVVTGNGNHTPQFDEQVRLIQAESAQDAFFKARFLGANEQVVFATEELNDVRWEFIDACELYELESFTDGMEIYSRIHETDQADTYISFVHHRAQQLVYKHQEEAHAVTGG